MYTHSHCQLNFMKDNFGSSDIALNFKNRWI